MMFLPGRNSILTRRLYDRHKYLERQRGKGVIMRKLLLYVGLVVLVVLVAGISTTLAARGSATRLYVFNGRLLADAGNSPTLFVEVKGGNRFALRKLVGHGNDLQFAVNAGTRYIRWSRGVPTAVSESNLVAADRVKIRIRAGRRASLAQIESTPAGSVADRGPSPGFAHKPLWLFKGKLAASASGGHLTLHITNGNLRALRAMLGQPLNQRFSYNRRTIFVLWQRGVPTVISPSQLRFGDMISVRVRAPGNSSLALVERTPANHVGDHEPGS